MIVGDSVSASIIVTLSVSAVTVLAVALWRSRRSEEAAVSASFLLLAHCEHLMRSESQTQANLKSAKLRVGELLAENQKVKNKLTDANVAAKEAQDKFATEHETVEVLTRELNLTLYEFAQIRASYPLMKAELQQKAAAAASHEIAHVYWKKEAYRLRGQVDDLNTEIADERAAEVASGITETVVTHAVALATGG